MTPEERATNAIVVDEDYYYTVDIEATVKNFAEAIRTAVAEEREACAQIVSEHPSYNPNPAVKVVCEGLAKLIRERT